MSNTPIQITTDLSKVLERIEGKIDDLQKDVEHLRKDLQKDVTDLKVGQARLEEKVDGLSKRVDNQEFTNRGILVALVVALIGGAAKLFGLIGVNP